MSHATSTPSGWIRNVSPYRPLAYVPSTAIPMAIPNARESPPPPLPPPRYINEIHEGQDPGWQWDSVPNGTSGRPGSFGAIRPGSSLLGVGVSGQEERTKSGNDVSQHDIGLRRRESWFSSTKISNRDKNPESLDHSDEARNGLTRPLANRRSRRPVQRLLKNSSQAYDKQILSKIGGPNSAQDASPGHESSFAKLNGLKHLSMPNQRYPSLDSPSARLTSSSGAVSPAQTGFGSRFRSPIFDPSSAEALNARRGSSVSAPGAFDESGSHSHRGSYDQSFLMDQSFSMGWGIGVEENQMRELYISDRSPSGSEDYQLDKAGLKRRATSPLTRPTQDRALASAGNDLYHDCSAQMLVNRNYFSSSYIPTDLNDSTDFTSPGPFKSHNFSPYDFPTDLNDSADSAYFSNRPLSRASSYGSAVSGVSHPPKPGNKGKKVVNMSYTEFAKQATNKPTERNPSSYIESWSLAVTNRLSAASNATSYSGKRLSPGALSSPVDTEFGPVSPTTTNMSSLNPSPRGSLSQSPQQPEAHHNRKMSANSMAPHSRQNSVSKIGGMYICDCCPKKPKKFDSEEELRIHEMEKQYTCAYCSNRFKNKNEAERHKNSVHLRRHSWSCAALAGVHAAFHPSLAHPTAADVCGYCGDEFPNPANWEVRAQHLNHVHHFGECIQVKKFFRADHFRQHLKHSHAGTSGKWTNMLENACMKDEPPPPKKRIGPSCLP